MSHSLRFFCLLFNRHISDLGCSTPLSVRTRKGRAVGFSGRGQKWCIILFGEASASMRFVTEQKLHKSSTQIAPHSLTTPQNVTDSLLFTNVSSFVMTVPDGPPPRLNVGRCQFFTPVTGPSKLFTVYSVFIIPATS